MLIFSIVVLVMAPISFDGLLSSSLSLDFEATTKRKQVASSSTTSSSSLAKRRKTVSNTRGNNDKDVNTNVTSTSSVGKTNSHNTFSTSKQESSSKYTSGESKKETNNDDTSSNNNSKEKTITENKNKKKASTRENDTTLPSTSSLSSSEVNSNSLDKQNLNTENNKVKQKSEDFNFITPKQKENSEEFNFIDPKKKDNIIDVDLAEKSKANKPICGVKDSLINHTIKTKENESSFGFVIKKTLCDKLFKMFNVDINRATDIIFHYSHGDQRHNRRCVNNTFQIKKYVNYDKYNDNMKILYIKGDDGVKQLVVPFNRKQAEEIKDYSHDDMTKVASITHRYILYNHDNIRIAIEYKFSHYHLVGEIEYEDIVLNNYNGLLKTEEKLWFVFRSIIMSCGFKVCMENFIIYKYVPQQVLSLIPGRKFSKFKEANFNYLYCKVMYKFNGYRGIMFVGPDFILYSDAIGNNCKININLSNNLLMGTMFQLEIMEEERMIIVTDILGIMYKNKQYMPDPLEAINFLVYSKINEKQIYIEMNRNNQKVKYLLRTQKYIKMNKLSVTGKIDKDDIPIYKDCRVDGYILITSNKIYKFKQPTVDVEIKNGEMYASKHDKPISKRTYPALEDGVWEIEPHCSDFCPIFKMFLDPKILRQRHDRSCGNTLDSITECLREDKYLSAILSSIK